MKLIKRKLKHIFENMLNLPQHGTWLLHFLVSGCGTEDSWLWSLEHGHISDDKVKRIVVGEIKISINFLINRILIMPVWDVAGFLE